ncbi:MAG: DUF2846 domain-containing protein [Gammaproteobacteria bacterium]|nr:DUF2846 domain-containing protein [Gammaproteobacteria bacterium]
MRNIKIVIILVLIGMINVTVFVNPAISADIPEAKVDKALVVFYRIKSMKGGAIGFNVKQGEAAIGALSNGSMFYRYVEPGQHTFWSQVISQDAVTINAEAGKTYYIEGVTLIGLVVARPQLRLVEQSQAKAAIANLN